jgi:histidinol-phosphate aminotransferase
MSSKGRVRERVERLSAYVPGEQPSSSDVVKLNTNENPYPPSPAVARALRELDVEALRRYPDPACGKLCRRLAELHGCAPENVFVANGSDEVLALATRAFVEDDGTIGFFHPSYSLYPVLAAIRGVAGRPVELGPAFEWRDPPGGDALFFLANPNAPTGMLHDRRTVETFCRAHGGVVIVDEAYVDFAEADCMDLALGLENVLVARTLSKSYSLAGLRLGYAVGHARLIEALLKVKDSYNVGAPAQALGLAALSDLGHMRRNAERIKTSRRALSDALARRGWTVCPSETNFVWAGPVALPARALFERLRERGIFVRHFPGERTGAFLRISVGTDGDVGRLLAAVNEIESEAKP